MNTRHLVHAAMAAAAMVVISAASPVHAQSVAVIVNGEPITHMDIDQRMKLNALSGVKENSRQAVIDALIDEKVKIKEAKKYSVDPGASEVDASYATMASRMRLTPDQLTQSLASKGIRPNTLKSRLKADMVWNAVVRGRFKQSLQVSERDVDAAAQSAGDANTEAFEYQMRPLVLIVPRGAGGGLMEARHKEAEALRGRIQSCEEASNTFKGMQNATVKGIVVKTSADLPPNLRDMLDKTPIGHLTAPEVTAQGIEMVALCSRKPTKIDTPKKREIREKMSAEKFDAKSKSYLADLRKAAMIEYR
ncbi:SurA N-terminal domain-containing protein [Rhodopseudomonas boonkerdii]|uniref:SurA N-terminal domain-containing protein n=1 Tax=Rhodopseudomonas boonkerdii TaxID=475937 RepID=UPI003D321593